MQWPTIGGPELIIVLLVVIVLFGGARLAGIGKSFGGAFRGFKEGLTDETASAEKEPVKSGARDQRR